MKRFFPVIHVESSEQALQNVAIATNAKIDGVFLINHTISYMTLLQIYERITEQYPNLWIGMNNLDSNYSHTFEHIPSKVSGVWIDNLAIDEKSETQIESSKIRDKFRSSCHALLFGGVAFKYQKHVDDVFKAAKIAADYCDIVTTSGPATGQVASIEKIKLMKEAIGDRSLAIASGINLENISEYIDYADYFLVSTGISKDFYSLDERKVSDLAQKIRSYRAK